MVGEGHIGTTQRFLQLLASLKVLKIIKNSLEKAQSQLCVPHPLSSVTKEITLISRLLGGKFPFIA